jgi:DNA-binding MarR family transcriptional regulator
MLTFVNYFVKYTFLLYLVQLMKNQTIAELNTLIDELIFSLVLTEKQLSHSEEMSNCQYRALRYINSNNGTSLRAVADFLEVTLPRASAVIDDLVNKGLVARKSSQNDRRKIEISLTKLGLKTLAATANWYTDISRKLADVLDDSERALLTKLSKKCSSCLSNEQQVV